MALPVVGQAAYPTPSEVRDAILRSVKYAYQRRGLTANVLPGSDHYIRAEANANRVSIAISNNKIASAAFNPLTATGDDLIALAAVFGVSPRDPSSAAGYVELDVVTGKTVTIVAGFQATAEDGLKYQTTGLVVGVADEALVQIQAVSTGTATDKAAGAVLTWDSASVGFLKPTCTVDAGGLTGGEDEDDDEKLRQRLLDRLAFPASGGNWAQIKQWATEASSSVAYAWVFQAARGPGSYDVVIASDDASRVLTTATINTVSAYIRAKMPGFSDLNVTSVSAQAMDIVLAASLPLPESAGGAGGGWLDPAPWPAETTKVTAYNSGTDIATVNSTATPTAGNHIGIWDPAGETMNEYVVGSTIGGSAGAWTFNVIGGFTTTPLNSYVSAGAENLSDYASEFYTLMQTLGCGEKTTSPDILPRALRKPGPDIQEPSDLTAQLLSESLLSQHQEILDLSYGARYLTGTTTTQTSPSVPATTANAPRVFTLQYFAIRKV